MSCSRAADTTLPGSKPNFFWSSFSGEERHVRRLAKVKALETRYR